MANMRRWVTNPYVRKGGAGIGQKIVFIVTVTQGDMVENRKFIEEADAQAVVDQLVAVGYELRGGGLTRTG